MAAKIGDGNVIAIDMPNLSARCDHFEKSKRKEKRLKLRVNDNKDIMMMRLLQSFTMRLHLSY